MDSALLWTFLLLQIFMGGLDTVYHHEFTERLAWRPAQRHELQLHGIRNLVYGLFFLAVGILELYGIFALLVLVFLAAEMIVTLTDFVEEDQTRKLPWTERILHTLLTLNYGVLLAFLVPVLLAWAGRPTGIALTWHGVFSLLMLPAAIGVAVFGLRDLGAAKRFSRLHERPAADLAGGLAHQQHVLVTGGTGFIGSRLVDALVAGGHDVTVLTRNAENAAKLATPIRIITGLNQLRNDTRIDTIINLAGQPLISGLWTTPFRRKVLFSRLRMSAALRCLVRRLDQKPEALINASAIGYYGVDKEDKVLTEYSRIDSDGSFSHRSCAAVERHAAKCRRFGLRVVTLRIGLVLDTSGGVLGNMLFPFEFGLGGPFGNGRQWMSWVSRDDTVRMIVHAIARPEIEGPLNVTAPNPVRNYAFGAALGRAFHRPVIFVVPAFVLQLLGDLGREIFLHGQRVLPTRALETGFIFLDPDLNQTLVRLTGAKQPASTTDEPQATGSAALAE